MNIGMNFHSPTLVNPEGLRCLDLRWALFLADPEELWNSTIHRWPEVKALCPRCEPVVRFYRPNVMGESPELRAQQFCSILNVEFGDQPIDAIMGNELDQAIEHGGREYEHDEDHTVGWDHPEALAVIAAWLAAYADAHRAIRPQDPIHLPAPSAGMDVADWYAAMKAGGAMQKYDVLDVHLYGSHQLSRLWDTQAIGNTFVSEVGIKDGTAEDIVALLKSLGHADFAWWKWNDKDDNPEGDPAGYAIADRQDVVDVLAKYAEANVDNTTPENDEVVHGLPIQEEEGNMSSELRRQWLQEYAAAHNGLFPTDWEFHKHELAIDANLSVTQADLDAVKADLAAIQLQRDLINDRLGGGSAPAPFQPD